MKKTGTLFALLISASCFVVAQDAVVPDLAQLYSTVKNPYIKVVALDKMQQDLKYFDEHPVKGNDAQQTLLDIYRSMANGYSVSSHYKQGYGVYQKYLALKENFLAAEKTDAISKVVRDIEEKQSKDENELLSKQNEIQQLELDNNYLEAKRKSFKQYFSFGVIALTVLFSFLLLQAGLRLNKIRLDLKTGRERLKVIHRISTLGRLHNGILLTIKSVFSSLKRTGEESLPQLEQLQQIATKKTEEINDLRKQLNALKNLL